MCKIENLKQVSVHEIVCQLSNPETRGFTIRFEDSRPQFVTSKNSRWRIEQKVIIAVRDTKNSCADRMVPHKEMKNIFSNFGVRTTLVDELKSQFPNLAFIAKCPMCITYF